MGQRTRIGAWPRRAGLQNYSMRTARYRYTEWRDWGTGEVIAAELYDHERDAGETRNVAGRGEMEETVRELAERLGETFPRRPVE